MDHKPTRFNKLGHNLRDILSSFIVFWVFLICILWQLLWLKQRCSYYKFLLVYQNHFYWLLWASNEFAYRTWLWHFQKFHFKNNKNSVFKISENFFYLFWRNFNFFEKSRIYIFWAGRAQIVEREVTGVNQYKRVCVLKPALDQIFYILILFYYILIV